MIKRTKHRLIKLQLDSKTVMNLRYGDDRLSFWMRRYPKAIIIAKIK